MRSDLKLSSVVCPQPWAGSGKPLKDCPACWYLVTIISGETNYSSEGLWHSVHLGQAQQNSTARWSRARMRKKPHHVPRNSSSIETCHCLGLGVSTLPSLHPTLLHRHRITTASWCSDLHSTGAALEIPAGTSPAIQMQMSNLPVLRELRGNVEEARPSALLCNKQQVFPQPK